METEKHIQAFDEFERDWKRRHKGSAVRKTHVSSWGLIFGIGIWIFVAIGAATFSGTHTVPAAILTISRWVESPAREYLSLTVFTILEIVIFAGSLYRRESRVALVLMILAMIGALAANIGSSIAAVSENGGDSLIMIVGVVMAVLAPSVALGAGEMSHRLWNKHQEKKDAVNATYDERLKDLDAKINRDYTKYLKEQESTHTQYVPGTGEYAENVPNTVPGIPARAVRNLADVLKQNPDDLKLSAAQIREKYGKGQSVANDAKKLALYELRDGYINGHTVQ